MVAQSIASWVKKHTKEETMALIGSGVTISFRQEAVTSRDEMFTLLLEGAYMYHQIQSGGTSSGVTPVRIRSMDSRLRPSRRALRLIISEPK